MALPVCFMFVQRFFCMHRNPAFFSLHRIYQLVENEREEKKEERKKEEEQEEREGGERECRIARFDRVMTLCSPL